MTFTGFSNNDFDVFKIDGLDERMEALKATIRPKLEELGKLYAGKLSVWTGDEMFAHVAKHARRTINPPKDTWVAIASNARGYKMMPHFQIGLWETHVFIWFAVIYEAPNKAEFGIKLEKSIKQIYKEIPDSFVWSGDHTKPETLAHSELSEDELKQLFVRLQNVKKAEILCGVRIEQDEAIAMSPTRFIEKADEVFTSLLPLYKMA